VSKNVYPFSTLAEPMLELLTGCLALRPTDRPSMKDVAKGLGDKASWYTAGKRAALEFYGLKELSPTVPIVTLIKVPEHKFATTINEDSSSNSGSTPSMHDVCTNFASFFTTKATKTKKQQHKGSAANVFEASPAFVAASC
jgi:hypothetical protein